MRIEKYLADTGWGSRKDIKQLLAQKIVTINDQVCSKGGTQVTPGSDRIAVGGQVVPYQRYHYYLLNKPAGILSATEDRHHQTVIDWLGEGYQHLDLFPVGRLDIDTTGLLLLTNNGQLAHQLLSPKKKVNKTYTATIRGLVDQADIAAFEAGLDLGDFTSLPAELTILRQDVDQGTSQIQVIIQEGKFHQVKRMFQAVGKEVLSLHRLAMGPLCLESDLALGQWRSLTEQEAQALEPYGYVAE